MEIVLYGAFTTVWWIASFSVFLPFLLLLKLSKSFRNRWFSWLFCQFLGPAFSPKLLPMRVKAFEMLKRHLSQRDKKKALEILEIGVGGGANLQYYPENSVLTALDMNESFEKYFIENQKKHPQVTYKKTVIGMAEDMPQIEDASMDIVVCTFVLCSVQDVDAVLAECKRVLKPGGKFLIVEHVAFPSSEWGSTIQRFAAPLWRIYCDGCCPDRDIADRINKAGFTHVEIEEMLPNLLLFTRPQIVCIATK